MEVAREAYRRSQPPLTRRDRFRGVLLGTAAGDSLGLPREGLSPGRAARLFGGELSHAFVLGRGMLSDDTEHTLFVSQSLLAHADSPDRFTRRLCWCLRGWLASLPAGIGLATLRAIVRLWLFYPWQKSGVPSAGNGPAMRAAPIGACFASSPPMLAEFLERSTRITHTDPRALTGAKAVSFVVAAAIGNDLGSRPEPSGFLDLLRSAGETDAEWNGRIRDLGDAIARDLSVPAFAESLGLGHGVTGFVYDTVPVAVYAWFRHFGDFEATVTAVIGCGGDTDTTGAIAGAMAGAVVGERGIPEAWLEGIADWPRGLSLLREVADRLAERSEGVVIGTGPVRYFWPGVVIRNLGFLALVLAHGFRRLAPPY